MASLHIEEVRRVLELFSSCNENPFKEETLMALGALKGLAQFPHLARRGPIEYNSEEERALLMHLSFINYLYEWANDSFFIMEVITFIPKKRQEFEERLVAPKIRSTKQQL